MHNWEKTSPLNWIQAINFSWVVNVTNYKVQVMSLCIRFVLTGCAVKTWGLKRGWGLLPGENLMAVPSDWDHCIDGSVLKLTLAHNVCTILKLMCSFFLPDRVSRKMMSKAARQLHTTRLMVSRLGVWQIYDQGVSAISSCSLYTGPSNLVS